MPNSMFLRTNLFGLYSRGVLSAEAQLCDGYVIQDDVKSLARSNSSQPISSET